jgi:hypothetical protein
VRLHQRLGTCLEAAYGAQAGEGAAELAKHFVRCQDTQRAAQYEYCDDAYRHELDFYVMHAPAYA